MSAFGSLPKIGGCLRAICTTSHRFMPVKLGLKLGLKLGFGLGKGKSQD